MNANVCHAVIAKSSLVMTLCLVLGGLSACTGSLRSTDSLYPSEYRSVKVPVMVNRSPYMYRGLERDMTEAVIKEIQARTPYQTLNSDVADTELKMTLRGVTQNLRTRTDNNSLPELVEVKVIVSWEWVDRRTGTIIRKRDHFESHGTYIPSHTRRDRIQVAYHKIADTLARDIVTTMQADW